MRMENYALSAERGAMLNDPPSNLSSMHSKRRRRLQNLCRFVGGASALSTLPSNLVGFLAGHFLRIRVREARVNCKELTVWSGIALYFQQVTLAYAVVLVLDCSLVVAKTYSQTYR